MTIQPKKAVQQLGAYHSPPEGRLPFVRLDLNENTVGFPDIFEDLDTDFPFNIYPEYDQLVASISKMFGAPSSNILLTNGSDEALSVIAHTFIEPATDSAIASEPTFFTITQSLILAGAKLIKVPVNSDMTFDLDSIEKALNSQVKIALFASPDNPTGAMLDQRRLLSWCKKFPNTLFVIDEAYAEYSGVSLMDRVLDEENLIVIRSFSKAWGLAGLRLGIVVGHADLIEPLKVVRLPYSVNSAAVTAAQRMLAKQANVAERAKETMQSKDSLIDALKGRGYRVIEGAGNFFLLGVGFNSKEFSHFLRQEGVLVRDRSQGNKPSDSVLWGFVRIAAGTSEENNMLLRAIDLFNARYAVSFDLDDTLVDTTESFGTTVELLVKKYSGSGLNNGELTSLRLEGGFNNNWDAAAEILRRRGVQIDRKAFEEYALSVYFDLAKQHERLMVDLSLLSNIRRRHPIFIITGRSRMEYEPLWAKTFDHICDGVYCVDDVPHLKPKPAPDLLTTMINNHKLSTAVYVGNSVDDVQAAINAGMRSIGITSTLSTLQLRSAGAHLTLESANELKEVFLL